MTTKEFTRSPVHVLAGLPKTRVEAPTEALIHEFDGPVPAPEHVVRLARGLGQHFPKARLSLDTTGGQLRVFAKEKSARTLALMRAFCAGFAVSLP